MPFNLALFPPSIWSVLVFFLSGFHFFFCFVVVFVVVAYQEEKTLIK